MMVRTTAARTMRFDEALSGYAQGEDLEFSLRLRALGRIGLLGAARCQHLHEPAGRPDAFRLGRMEICNRYRIWRRAHPKPGWRDRLSFTYAWTLDTLLLMRDTVRPRHAADGLQRIAGRVIGASQLVTKRSSA
jgi:hypothetical protein